MIARIVALLLIVAVLAGVAFISLVKMQPLPQYVQGQVESTKVNVSAKIPGRVEEMLVEEGQSVAKGDLLAVLDSPQLQAKKQQADGAKQAASAQHNKAENGAREEQVRMAYNQWQQAQAGLAFAQKSFARIENLYKDGVVPAHRYDEVESKLKMTEKLVAMAKAQYDMALDGARDEDKDAAKALVTRADGAVSEVNSLIEEASVRAPLSGEVLEHVVNLGELASAGMPIVTIVDLDDVWVTFNMREDRLAGLKMGEQLSAQIPALNNEAVDLEVTYIAALGDFATWRATSALGGFDLRTFEVRARPTKAVDGLRPGMSVLVPWDRVTPEDPLAPVRGFMKQAGALFAKK